MSHLPRIVHIVVRASRWTALPVLVAVAVLGGGVFKIDYYTLDIYDYTQLNKANPLGRKISTLDLRGTGALLDPGIKPTRTDVYNVGTEIQLGKYASLGVGYVHRAVANANEDARVLLPDGTNYQNIFGNPGQNQLAATYGAGYPTNPLFERIYDDVNPNVGIYCDYLEGCYTASGTVDYGRLSADRPHQFKMSGFYSFPWGLTAGLFFQAASGTPVTANLVVNKATVTHPTGRGGDGRNPLVNQTDLSLQYGFKLAGRMRLSAVLNIINVFDQDEATRTYQNMLLGGSSVVSVPRAQYFQGYDYKAVVAASGSGDPRFLMFDRYQAPRSMRVGVKIEF